MFGNSVPVGKSLIAISTREGIQIRRVNGIGRPVLLRWRDVRNLAGDVGELVTPSNLLTLEQVAALVGLRLGSIYQAVYKSPHAFPAPVHRLGVVKFYSRESIVLWNARRLKAPNAKRS